MQQLTPEQFKDWVKANKEHVLVDIREDWERQQYNIGGLHIPMGELMAHLAAVPKDKDVVFYCEKGIRSVITIQRLESLGFTRLFNLSGGMKAWKEAN